MSVVVLLVLGIACANVANLLLSQSASRQREMAVRIALGATRRQLLGQMLMESSLLALAGGLFGTLLTLWATSALSAFRIPAPVPLDTTVSLDWRVLLYTFILSVGTGLLFGFGPAWIASRPILASALKGEDGFARPGRRLNLRNVLVVTQIVMSLVLLCATGLFLRSLERAVGIDIGFRSHDLLMLSVDPRVHGYTPERTTQFLEQLRERVAAIPGVLSVAATDSAPLSGGNRSDGFHAETSKPNDPYPIVELYMATPGYFETMGIPRLAGRDFNHEAANTTRVGIVNRAFAEHFFGRENPIGHRVTGGGVTYEIIGVVENIKSRTLGEDTRYVLFRSLAQSTGSDPSFLGYQLVVHFQGNAAGIASAVRNRIHDLDPAMAVYNAETMQQHLRQALFLPRLAGTLFGIFGFVGLGARSHRPLRRHQLFGQPPHPRNWYPHCSRSPTQRRPSAHSSPGHDTHHHRHGDWTACGLRARGSIEQLSLRHPSPRHHDLHHCAVIPSHGGVRCLLGSGTARDQG